MEKQEQYSIKITKETLKKLKQLKLDWDCKSINQVIERLEVPKTK